MNAIEISKAEHDAFVAGAGWIQISRSADGQLEWKRVEPQLVTLAGYHFEPPGLRELVDAITYKAGWHFDLVFDKEPDGSGGLTLWILSDTEDSIRRGERIRVRHSFLVPPATYNRDTWAAWLFDRVRDVESHEAAEFFKLNGLREFAPHHGNGEDPYRVWHVGDWATAAKRAGDA